MRNAKTILAAVLCCVFVGCSDSKTDKTASTSRNDAGENATFGSATDITPADGTGVQTNNLNVADNGIGGPAQRATGNYQSEALPGQQSDEELAKKIKVALTTGSMGTTGAIAENQLTKIGVRVQNGIVVLTGPVASEEEKKTVEKQVAGMSGVKSVRNLLTVGGRNLQNTPLQPLVPRTEGNR